MRKPGDVLRTYNSDKDGWGDYVMLLLPNDDVLMLTVWNGSALECGVVHTSLREMVKSERCRVFVTGGT